MYVHAEFGQQTVLYIVFWKFSIHTLILLYILNKRMKIQNSANEPYLHTSSYSLIELSLPHSTAKIVFK